VAQKAAAQVLNPKTGVDENMGLANTGLTVAS
jgi:hypothetical protein